MNRKTFLKTVGSASAFLAFPFNGIAVISKLPASAVPKRAYAILCRAVYKGDDENPQQSLNVIALSEEEYLKATSLPYKSSIPPFKLPCP